MNFNNLKLLVLAVGMVALVGCGGSKQNAIQAPSGAAGTGGSSASAAPACTSSSCPEVIFNFGFTGATEGDAYVGAVGQDVNWGFLAGPQYGEVALDKDPNSARPAGLFFNEDSLPDGASVVGGSNSLTNTIAISWVPSKIGVSSKNIVLYARDMAKCILNNSAKQCNIKKFTSKYDQEFSGGWKIVDATADQTNGVVNVSGDCQGTPTSDGQIMSSVLTAGMGILTGGGMGSMIPLASNALAGMVNGDAQQDPANCLH